MLFNRFFSLVVLASFALYVLAVPVEAESELDSEAPQSECDRTSAELASVFRRKSLGLPLSDSGEAKIANYRALCGPNEQEMPSISMAAAILVAQRDLDKLVPQIATVMSGPLGSIEGRIGELITAARNQVGRLAVKTRSFIGVSLSMVYGNPTGGPQLTNEELAKVINTYFSHASELKDTVKNVSGYTVTSALGGIQSDMVTIKKTLEAISPELAGKIQIH